MIALWIYSLWHIWHIIWQGSHDLKPGSFVFLCVCVRLCTCKWQHIMYGCQKLIYVLFYLSPLYFWKRVSHWSRNSLILLDWVAIETLESSSLCLPKCWDYRHTKLCPDINLGARDLTSAPQACTASTLLAVPSPFQNYKFTEVCSDSFLPSFKGSVSCFTSLFT